MASTGEKAFGGGGKKPKPASGDWPYPSLASRSFNEWRSSWYLQSVHQQVNMWCKTITTSLKPANVYCILVAWSLLPLYALWCSLLGLIRLISLNAMGAFMCPYKIEKSVFFILTPNIMNSCEPNGCIKTWLGKGYASPEYKATCVWGPKAALPPPSLMKPLPSPFPYYSKTVPPIIIILETCKSAV